MRIFVFPVSGGAFPIQLGLVSELTLHGSIYPDIAMGSSGGNVSSYVCLAGKWNHTEIMEVASKLHSGIFAQSWWPSYLQFLPSWIIGYFKGSIYNDGFGASELFNSYFTPDTIKSTEIWTGTLNRATGKGQFFCNRSCEESIIRPIQLGQSYPSLFSRDCMPLTYLNGNIDIITRVTMASASIPVLVPEKNINGQIYVDGGTLFASPLTALQDHILEILELNPSPLHIDYFSSYDLQANSTNSYRTLYENSTLTIGELVKSICIQDRLSAIELLRSSNSNCFHYTELSGTPENLKIVENIRKESVKSVLELYPCHNTSINLISFTGKDVIQLIELTKKSYRLRFWWLGNPNYDIIENLPNYRRLNLSRLG